ncbi:MOSC domain-containing protein [Fibrella sp. HMF5335]|uniref:MOSC domain-containing protein n=1 Tax=Fibrella rubiginis TaxID=2817060 RepID=A0A939GHP1_9BACT|nr:MOSC domain-containing protein [Fibrella rubiginis]MBO0936966.1 MOSC domain-containing protein [Fibrella rubiginis]
MHLVSVNISLPQTVSWQGQPVSTGIFKQPVTHPVPVETKHLTGDGQADLRVHGGRDKAVYAYPLEHYAYWQGRIAADLLTMGAFGENLTTSGLLEQEVCIGDVFQVGTAVLMAVQPRLPCFKLGIRLNDPKVVKQFAQSGHSGIYFRVMKPGTLQVGDSITRLAPSDHRITIQQMNELYWASAKDKNLIQALQSVPFLPAFWQRTLRRMTGKAA